MAEGSGGLASSNVRRSPAPPETGEVCDPVVDCAAVAAAVTRMNAAASTGRETYSTDWDLWRGTDQLYFAFGADVVRSAVIEDRADAISS